MKKWSVGASFQQADLFFLVCTFIFPFDYIYFKNDTLYQHAESLKYDNVYLGPMIKKAQMNHCYFPAILLINKIL